MLGFECRRAVVQEPRARHLASIAAAQLVCWRRSSWQLQAGVDGPHTKRKISRRPFSTCRTSWPIPEAEHATSAVAAAQQPKFSAFESSNDVMSEEEAHTFIFNHEVLPPEADTGQWIGEVHFIPCGHYMHVACALQCAMEGAMPEGSDPLGFTGLGLTEHVPVIPRQCLACSGPVHEALITCRYGKACRKDKATPPYTLT